MMHNCLHDFCLEGTPSRQRVPPIAGIRSLHEKVEVSLHPPTKGCTWPSLTVEPSSSSSSPELLLSPLRRRLSSLATTPEASSAASAAALGPPPPMLPPRSTLPALPLRLLPSGAGTAPAKAAVPPCIGSPSSTDTSSERLLIMLVISARVDVGGCGGEGHGSDRCGAATDACSARKPPPPPLETASEAGGREAPPRRRRRSRRERNQAPRDVGDASASGGTHDRSPVLYDASRPAGNSSCVTRRRCGEEPSPHVLERGPACPGETDICHLRLDVHKLALQLANHQPLRQENGRRILQL